MGKAIYSISGGYSIAGVLVQTDWVLVQAAVWVQSRACSRSAGLLDIPCTIFGLVINAHKVHQFSHERQIRDACCFLQTIYDNWRTHCRVLGIIGTLRAFD
jgi:hypothetical protein